MTSTPRPVRLHIAPSDHDWAPPLQTAAEDAGATIVPAADASALLWLLNTGGQQLTDLLHDGIGWVQLRSAGVEQWIDDGALDADRQWTAARGIYAQTVAEHALLLALSGLKLLPQYARAQTWDPDGKHQGRLLRDCTVAVIGAGGIGTEIIRYLAPMGPHVVAITRSGRQVEGAHEHLAAADLDTVWPRADVIILAAPATAETHHLVGNRELDAMRDDAWIVNIARGALIDTDALTACLARGGIGGAALDVTDPEPLPDGHPLWSEPRALITPHAANPGAAQLPRLCSFLADNIQRYADGRPLQGLVDLDAGY
jgi:phosphoglycerate dehydrogenase-like enzyme